MANITPQNLPAGTPLAATFVAAAGGGDVIIQARSGMLVVFNNLHSADWTVTVESEVGTSEGYAEADEPILVPFATDFAFWIIPPQYISVTNTVALTYSGVTLLTLAAFRLPE